MTTMIEKLLARMMASRDELEAKIEKASNVNSGPSAFVDVGPNPSVSELMAAASADNMTKAAARLRALHEPVASAEPSRNPFGTPRSQKIIDAEFVEVKPNGELDGSA